MNTILKLIFLVSCVISGYASADTVYVSLEKADAIAVIDGNTGKLNKLVEVGKRPRGLVLSQDNTRLYVAVSDENVIKIIDTATLKILGKLDCDKAKTFALSPDGNLLYATNDGDNQLTVINIPQGQIIKRIPIAKEAEGVSVSPDGRWIISTSEAENLAEWIDGHALEVVDKTLVDMRPRASEFTADGKQLWVTSQNAADLSILDVQTRRPLKKIAFSVPGTDPESVKPVGIRIDKQRRFAYVALGRANHIAVIDAQKLEVIKYLPVGQRVWNLAFSPDQKKLYAANGLSDEVSFVDLETHQVINTVAVGKTPWAIVSKP
ncbi:MAG: PQQ-dependent catabolism-associated beta-propeller protein [Methylococcaceae bacterium]|nr:PQQ-dependent catabolism-associated beta-propeller protein [Methylococcaceae bacterium]